MPIYFNYSSIFYSDLTIFYHHLIHSRQIDSLFYSLYSTGFILQFYVYFNKEMSKLLWALFAVLLLTLNIYWVNVLVFDYLKANSLCPEADNSFVIPPPPRVRSTREGIVLTRVCVSVHTRGFTPSPSHNISIPCTSTGPMSFTGGGGYPNSIP